MPSQSFTEDLFAPESDDPLLVLLTIFHADLSGGLFRAVNNSEDIISRGNTFVAWPFEFTPPEQAQGQINPPTIRIDNIHRDLLKGLRDMEEEPDCIAEVILASDPDTVEMTFPRWKITSVPYDDFILTGQISPPDDDTEPVVGYRFTPAYAPGIFKR